ncbi:MAG: hypothetical protein H7A32_00265 [Deltaproteobacteria bacterium]|nr:hypothetical protein [Deltaproteobacteria bacterium]
MNFSRCYYKKTKKNFVRLSSLFLVTSISFFPFFQLHAQKAQKKSFQLEQKEAQLISPSTLSQKVDALLFEYSNQQREKKGLPALKHLEVIQKAARDHSQDMMKRQYLSHFSPEKKSVVDRVAKYVKEVRASLGENLHSVQSQKGLTDPEAIAKVMMEDWMGSKSHRANILGEQFTRMEIACVSSWTQIYCTQVFAGEGL